MWRKYLVPAAVGVLVCWVAATPASAVVTLADFTSDTGVFNITGEVASSSIGGGELTIVTAGGFTNVLHDNWIPRTGASTPDSVTASDLLAYPVIEWDWRADDVGSTGTFINNHLVFNSDQNGIGYRVLANSGSYIPPNNNNTGTHAYDLTTDAEAFQALQDWSNNVGGGTYFQMFVVQQTNGGEQSTVHYDEFRARIQEVPLLADFDEINLFSVAGDVTADSISDVDGDGDNELTLTTETGGGWANALYLSVPRSGRVFDALNRDDAVIEWDYQSLDADNDGSFINNHLVVNTNAGGSLYEARASQFINPGIDDSGTFSYDIGADPVFRDRLAQFAAGDGNYLQLFMIQQTNGGTPATVSYDDFRVLASGQPEAIPEPSTIVLLALGGLALLYRRRSKGAWLVSKR